MVEAEKVTIEERSSKEKAGKTVIINPMMVLDGNAFTITYGVAVINKVSCNACTVKHVKTFKGVPRSF